MIPVKAVIYDEATLREVCIIWQQRLLLSDWHVVVDIVRQWDMAGDAPTSVGQIKIVEQERCAWVKILNPVDYKPNDKYYPQDMDYILVHELLHIWMVCACEERYTTTEEQAINAIAGALVAGWRGDA